MDRVRAGLGDRYHLVRELGRGGMAVVYLAYDVRHDRQVAIKVLQPELAHLIGTERFLREIRVAANLTHPNILPLHDSGEVDGLLYYIMPHIEGESLKERLSREGTLPVEDAVRFARQIAGALQYAHERGVVHRDIKPANILIAGDQVVLADFGIARAVDTAPTDGLTGTGVAIGTPAYMSPEQVTGGEVDGRSDLYGLACMLYEMLTGDPPFSAPTTQGVMSRQAVDRLPRIAKEHGVPRSVEIAIEKAMAKAPADRFRDGTEFAAALDTGPTLTATLGGLVRVRSGKRLGAALGLVVAVVGSAFLGSRVLGGDPPAAGVDAQAVAVLPFRVGSGATDSRQGRLANDIPQLLYERLPGEGGPRAVLPTAVASALHRAGLSETQLLSPAEATEIAVDVGAGQVLLGTVVGAGDQITLNATLYDAIDGSERARAETMPRPPDSLLALVDELAAKLLSRQAGVPEHVLPSHLD